MFEYANNLPRNNNPKMIMELEVKNRGYNSSINCQLSAGSRLHHSLLIIYDIPPKPYSYPQFSNFEFVCCYVTSNFPNQPHWILRKLLLYEVVAVAHHNPNQTLRIHCLHLASFLENHWDLIPYGFLWFNRTCCPTLHCKLFFHHLLPSMFNFFKFWGCWKF